MLILLLVLNEWNKLNILCFYCKTNSLAKFLEKSYITISYDDSKKVSFLFNICVLFLFFLMDHILACHYRPFALVFSKNAWRQATLFYNKSHKSSAQFWNENHLSVSAKKIPKTHLVVLLKKKSAFQIESWAFTFST